MMVDQMISAFDVQFLTRFAFAVVFYWFWGILSKGIFEPIQAQLGRRLFAFWHRSNIDLYEKAIQSCSELDDLFLGYISNASGRINEIVNPNDPQQKKLVESLYRLDVLVDKATNGR